MRHDDSLESLEMLGWDDTHRHDFASYQDNDLVPARVVGVFRDRVVLAGLGRPVEGSCSGRLLNALAGPLGLPTVGDWVACRRAGDIAIVEHVLPRRSVFVRKVAGRRAAAQLVAANLDCVLVVTAVGRDLNPRRVERYLAAVWAGAAEPVVVVNKTDLPHDRQAVAAELGAVASGAPVVLVSALAEHGLEALDPWLAPGATAAFVGSSGVGKSTLINRLMGRPRQATAPVRAADDKGRHTTSHRELLVTPRGLCLIDTPGMRELALWDAREGVASTFSDIESLARVCRFRDCTHEDEPGCAVLEAEAGGVLPPGRLASYQRLQRELDHTERRADEAATNATKKRWKSITRSMRVRRRLNRKLGLKDW